ncbi:MAG: extracellular solute-binding protein [Defluviitaleaceae bacterium]|nr:extracellular solute-binding protein [Defluviitaleaceae bacterium]
MKRILCILLALSLVVAAFAACGGTSDNNSSGNTPTQAASSGGDISGGDAVTDDRPLLTYSTVIWGVIADFEQRACWDVIEDKFNINFKFEFVSEDLFNEKINIMVQTDTLPDFGCFGDNPIRLHTWGDEGFLMPLNDFIENQGTHIRAKWATYPQYREACTGPNGKIYWLPLVQFGRTLQCDNHLFVNQSFLKELGMEMPTTTDEFYRYLRGVKDNDVNGNGDMNDEIPLISMETMWAGFSLFHSRLVSAFTPVTMYDMRIISEDGIVSAWKASDGFREAMRYLRRLYEEELWYNEALVWDQATQYALTDIDPDYVTIGAGNGIHGHAVCNWESTRWLDYEALAPLNLANGGSNPRTPGGVEIGSQINAKCPNPERLFEFLDWMASEEGSWLATMGIEGIDYLPAQPGDLTVNGDVALARRMYPDGAPDDFIPSTMGFSWPWYSTAISSNPYWFDFTVGYQSAWDKFTTNYYLDLYTPGMLPASRYWPQILYYDDPDLNDEMAILNTDMWNTMALAQNEFVTGVRDVEKDWDAYLAELNRMGLPRFLEISQLVYNNSKGK